MGTMAHEKEVRGPYRRYTAEFKVLGKEDFVLETGLSGTVQDHIQRSDNRN